MKAIRSRGFQIPNAESSLLHQQQKTKPVERHSWNHKLLDVFSQAGFDQSPELLK
jgi:hypothetical protein